MDIDENAPGNRSQQGVTRTTDNETGHDPRREASEVPLPPDDEAAVEEDMTDVEAGNSVLSEHPEAGNHSRDDHPHAGSPLREQGDERKETRDVPASDPESGA